MTSLNLYTQFSSLPISIQNELIHYLEFLVEKNIPKKTHPKAGFMKGSFIMKDDFNEPLDDFKEYM